MSHMCAGQPCIVIEDDKLTRQVVSQYLEGLMRPMLVSTGQEGLSLLSKMKPAIALIDFHLPDFKLPQLVTEIRRLHPSLPLIAMSADATADVITQSRNAGVNGFLVKPLSKDKLLSRIFALPATAMRD